MSLILAAALVAAPAYTPVCSWDRPGHDPFMGDVVAAVDRYADIPAATRGKLKKRMSARDYDEIVSIRRDAIVGKARYGEQIRDMHFGTGQVCGTVSRARWSADAQERGLVYCEDGHCILVPTVCRNVSRIQREAAPVGPAAALGLPGGDAGGPGLAAMAAAPPAIAGLPGPAAPVASNLPAVEAPGSFASGARAPLPGAEGLAGVVPDMGLIAPAAPSAGVVTSAAAPSIGAGAAVPAPWLPGLVGGAVAGGVVGVVSSGDNVAAGIVGPPFPGFNPNLVGAIPEPGSWALMAAGLLALLGWRRVRR